jgi:hypothetical protein
MGFNPGGDPGERGPSGEGTIGSSITAVKVKEAWNDWADERYAGRGRYSPLQRNIRFVFEELGADPRRTFSTNALFVRSSRAEGLSGPWDLWWDICWPVHQAFPRVVRPRLVVCLGNGRDLSTWELMRQTGRGPPYTPNWQRSGNEVAKDGKWRREVTFELGGSTHTCAILGLPHPSPQVQACWPLSPAALKKTADARAALVGWGQE